MMVFAQPYRLLHWYCFVLEVQTLGRFQNRICIVSNHHIRRPGRKIKFYNDSYGSSYWLSIPQNLKRDKAIIRIKHKNCSKQWEFKLWYMNFWRFCPGRDQWKSLTYGMSSIRVCMESDFLSVQVIESQLCLWIWFFPLCCHQLW